MNKNDKAYVPPLEGRRGKLRLDFNENTAGCSPAVLRMLNNLEGEDVATYPEYGELRSRLALALDIPQSRLVTTNGADEAIRLVCNLTLGRGRKVVIPDPSFAMWRVNAQQLNADIADVPYLEDLSFPTEGVLQALETPAELVVVVSPNNPTGTSVTRQDLLRVLESAGEAVVAVDEAYYEFSGATCLDLLDRFPNLVVIRTFSKAYGMAGLRLGYAAAEEKLAGRLQAVNSPYGVNALAVKAALAALEDREYVDDYVARVKRNRGYLIEKLAGMGIGTYQSDANFVLARLGERKARVIEELSKQDILVRDMARYPLLSDCMRITVGTVEQMDAFLEALNNIIGGMKE